MQFSKPLSIELSVYFGYLIRNLFQFNIYLYFIVKNIKQLF